MQIIKNVELEELRELGFGPYGTVYHGRWRGSDVAIKRIKESCFAGRSSEEERPMGHPAIFFSSLEYAFFYLNAISSINIINGPPTVPDQ